MVYPRHSGAPRSGEPGIHNHEVFDYAPSEQEPRGLWLWIPGSALPRGPGMTTQLRPLRMRLGGQIYR